ncbi:hypothetical protein QE177_09120 [Arsenophonus sp. aPb]|uniref:hypothetical protein n=1 Tax=Arsenophonus sp. aPb TaxID=3041619 RepID=UPI0024696EA3|nr:hypothetical protein [Arsenophonus sp. aPb]WGL97382.1 hypothetical protein QE177_09120 [Arsenophonus sp. aPb]
MIQGRYTVIFIDESKEDCICSNGKSVYVRPYVRYRYGKIESVQDHFRSPPLNKLI